jgi:hypothetical protein
VSDEYKLRPGVVLITWGTILIGHLFVAVSVDKPPQSRFILVECLFLLVAAGVCWWGWHRLREAKASHPELSWWRFLRSDLICLGLIAAFLAVFAAMSKEQRDDLARSMREFYDLIEAGRGFRAGRM